MTPPSLAGSLGHLLRRAHTTSLSLAAAASLPTDRHLSDIAVLTAVESLGPASQRLLADRLAINPRVMVQIVDRLEADGLVVRGRDPDDRRRYAVSLTAAGRRAYQQLDRAATRHTAALTRNLTAAERRRLNKLLTTVLATPAAGLLDPPAKLTERTGFLVARAHFALRGVGREQLGPLGVEPRHFAALLVVADVAPTSQQRVADELGVSGTIVVQLADHLEAGGLIQRSRDPHDRRIQHLTITPKGKALLPEARSIVDEATIGFTEPIGTKGAHELVELLRKLLDG